MNAFENFFCSSSLWRYFTTRHLLPWTLSGSRLGDHLLEIGAGSGAATSSLNSYVSRVTSLEYAYKSAIRLKSQNGSRASAVCGDAARLPFACQTFSSALAILVLHHLRSAQFQDQMFVEVFRVLRPGGVFIAFEIQDRWFHRLGHIRSRFTPLLPSSVFLRLSAAGFSKITLDVHKGAFRLSAIRPAPTESSTKP